MSIIFAQRLKSLRKETHTKQSQISALLGFGPSAISNYETGRNEPSLNELIKIADYFNVSTDYLVGHSEMKNINCKNTLSDFYKCFENITVADSLKLIMMDAKSSVEEKNNAFEKMKNLNINKGEETKLEESINKEFSLKTFVKIEGDQIKVVVNSSEHNTSLANKIMRHIQSNYDKKMYITVEFK